jgi:hypothetical protein
VRRVLFRSETPIQIWLTRDKARPSVYDLQRQAEMACLMAKVPNVPVLVIECDASDVLQSASCSTVSAPPIIRNDYAELVAEADRQRARYTSLNSKKRKKGKGRKKR